jgi:hypothetical protein
MFPLETPGRGARTLRIAAALTLLPAVFFLLSLQLLA